MKKTLCLSAWMVGVLVAGAAQAETSVTLYGIIDSGYGYLEHRLQRHDNDVRVSQSGLVGGTLAANRFGLKGAEDLGGGLRAVFTLEQGFSIGSGGFSDDTRQFSRQAFVGLASDDWGSVTMGRQYNAGVDVGIVENGDGTTGLGMGSMDQAFGGPAKNAGTRIDNSFKYTSPNFAGLTAIVMYATPKTSIERSAGVDQGNEANRSNFTSAGLKYEQGPLAIGLSYDRASRGEVTMGDFNTTAFSKSAVVNWNIGVTYDFEIVKLALAYGHDQHGKLGMGYYTNDYVGAISGRALNIENYENFKSNDFHLGVSTPVGGGVLYAGWNHSSSNLDASQAAGGWGDLAGNIDTYHVNYQYPLSKRTYAYVYASYGKNLGYVDGLDGREAGLGMMHMF
ncbi:porin [Castellaniella caeni]|uniref:porin n=1 Tax=Castellaniella caeni TaxID=266123 RepID=UPI000B12032F|nr:porin [Castellaniella caeni]